MSSTFRVFRVHKDGNNIKGRVETSTLDELSPGEVTLRAEYSSVNYKDALAATGKGQIIRRFPLVAGIDVAGEVVESSDNRFSQGDRVLVTGYEFGTNHDGGYAEMVRVPGEWIVPVPEGMSNYQAMALGTAGFTVALCVHRLEANGQNPGLGPFIITGSTGGVGMYAIDILSKLGYDVVAMTGKKRRAGLLKDLGASNIIDRTAMSFDGPPLEKGQWGGAIDNVGGQILSWLTRTVVPWGSIASVGLAGGVKLETTVMPFILRGVSLLGVTSANCPTELRHQLWQRLATDLAPAHMDKIVTEVAGLDDLPSVFNKMLAGKHVGRTVIKISD